jgi:hypothetical protein
MEENKLIRTVMKMIINEKYKLDSDSLNVIIYYRQEAREVGKGGCWKPLAFFATPQNALKFLVNREIIGTGMEELKTIVKKIEELKKVIDNLKGLLKRQGYE